MDAQNYVLSIVAGNALILTDLVLKTPVETEPFRVLRDVMTGITMTLTHPGILVLTIANNK